mgnify:CR=1 FL=1
MSDNEYFEFKARLANDTGFLRRLVLDVLKGDLLPGVQLQDPKTGMTVVKHAPEGHITYAQAAAILQMRVESIRRHVSELRYVGSNGLIVEADFVRYVMGHLGKVYRERLVQHYERAGRAVPTQRELPLLDKAPVKMHLQQAIAV